MVEAARIESVLSFVRDINLKGNFKKFLPEIPLKIAPAYYVSVRVPKERTSLFRVLCEKALE